MRLEEPVTAGSLQKVLTGVMESQSAWVLVIAATKFDGTQHETLSEQNQLAVIGINMENAYGRVYLSAWMTASVTGTRLQHGSNRRKNGSAFRQNEEDGREQHHASTSMMEATQQRRCGCCGPRATGRLGGRRTCAF